MSVLRAPHTPPMTPDDMRELFRQCRELGWTPSVLLIGGEPTMHPDFMEFVRLGREFVGRGLVQIWSNGYSADARRICDEARVRYDASVVGETVKPNGSAMDLSIDDIFVSPKDYGHPTFKPCWNHAAQICGVSVDSQGYAPCALGGMIDGMLGVGGRTKRLADLFNIDAVRELTRKLCEHCGQSMIGSGENSQPDPAWREYVEAQPKRLGSYMSPTWLAGAKGRR